MTTDKPTEPETLTDAALETAIGGAAAWPTQWKISGFDGKGHDDVARSREGALGGFSDVSGLGREIT